MTANPAAAQEASFPALAGRVVDQAGLLAPEDESYLTDLSEKLEAETGDQMVIATVDDLEGRPIEDYAVALARQWALGQAEADNGVLLLVAPTERKVRIEVGYGLEPDLTDLVSKLIIEGSIVPAFKRGDFAAGIRRGAEDISAVLTGDREAWLEDAKQRVQDDGLEDISLTSLIFYGIFFLVVFSGLFGRKGRGRRGRRGAGPIFLPGGRRGGFGRGGGGFSGGGGSFGGGGASGGW